MKNTSIPRYCILLSISLAFISTLNLQAQKKILIDVAHGQRFWNDPSDMNGNDPQFVERVKYMTGEITKSAKTVKADVGYVKSALTPEQLKKCDLLFIHLPSAKYNDSEIKAIHDYLNGGGSLFLVMDVDYWSTLEQTNVNDIVKPYAITFKHNSADTLSGGYTNPGAVTSKTLKVTYHGARTLEGGTPFAFNKQSNEPFATAVETRKGGKIIAMGDGMVSLYMTSWKDVTDYQCQEFMQDAFAWLLK